MATVLNGNGHACHKDAVIDSFIKVDKVSTHWLQLGQLQKRDANRPRYLYLVIPGNPGVPTFYENFMEELYAQSNGQIPVWAIGHAEHTQPPNESLTIKHIVKTDEEKYGLEAQIRHKVAFIKQEVPSDVKLILIGHSIGCYMILNLLERISADSVERCFLLFPTLERMAISPNGLSLTPVFRYLRWIVVLLAFFCALLPQSLRCLIIRYVYRKVEYPVCMTPAILTTLRPWTVNFSTYLAKLEMGLVTDLQKDIVKKHLHKLSLYYGALDLWCPQQYYEETIKEFPTIDARMCQLNMKHAFVMVHKEGVQMAQIIWQWLPLSHISNSMSNGVRKREVGCQEI